VPRLSRRSFLSVACFAAPLVVKHWTTSASAPRTNTPAWPRMERVSKGGEISRTGREGR
jgi:hypothetical protein